MKGKVNLYGCGGAGIKLAAAFRQELDVRQMAELVPCYIDTSLSNITPLRLPDDSCYIFEGCDGSGSKRDENAGVISAKINQVLEKFPPSAPLNIVISSASGGTGSVVGSYLTARLLEAGCPTVYLLIGSCESILAVKNTINTLMGLDKIARKQEMPAVISFHSNGANKHNAEVDAEVIAEITSLAILGSRQSPGLDTEDLRNWVQFHRVSDVEPQLALLDIVKSVDEASKIQYPVSIASLLSGTSTIGELGADYFCDGPIPSDDLPETHFIINVIDGGEILDGLKELQKSMKQRSAARPKTQRLSAASDDDCELVM